MTSSSLGQRSFRGFVLSALVVAVGCAGRALEDGPAGGGGGSDTAGGGSLQAGAVAAGEASGGGSGAGAGESSAGEGGVSVVGEGGSSAGEGGSSGSEGSVDVQACESNAECTYIPNRCCTCNFWNPITDYVAINSAYAQQFLPKCTADCAVCPPYRSASDAIGFVPYYVATCQHSDAEPQSASGGHCMLVDLRATDVTVCSTKADCALRAGTQCCPDCGGHGYSPVSINSSKEAELEALRCSDMSAVCPACTPKFDGYQLTCNAGRCGGTFVE